MGFPTDQLKSDLSRRKSKFLYRVALAAVGLFAGSMGFAQQPAPASSTVGGLEEVIITAEKRAESVQKIPSSITALTAEDLAQRGIAGVQGLMSGNVPSVHVIPFAGNTSVLEVGVRGFLDPNGADITQEILVPTYVDDVFYGRETSLALEMNDLENISILRGPQGTLFGKNAMGGALVLTSKKPTGEFGVDVKAESGNFGYWKGVAHVNLPSIGGVKAKVDFISTDNDGWTKNPGPGQLNFGVLKSTGGKLTLLYDATDAFRIEYSGDYTDMKSTEGWNAPVGTFDPYLAVWPVQLTTPKTTNFQVYRPYDPQVYWGHRLSAEFKINDSVSLKSITAYRYDKALLNNTADASAVVPEVFLVNTDPTSPRFGVCPISGATGFACAGAITGIDVTYDIHHHQASQEFQLIGKQDHLDWVLGAFYLKESGAQIENAYAGTYLPNSVVGILPPPFPQPGQPGGPLPALAYHGSTLLGGPGIPLSAPIGAAITSTSSAAFGQLTWRPAAYADKFAVTAGVRIGTDKKEALRPLGSIYRTIPWPAGPGLPSTVVGVPCPQSAGCAPSVSITKTSPLLALTYNWTPDVSTYFRFSTGYQAPGLSVGSQLFKYVASSTVNNYELGFKSEWADHRLRLNISAFYDNWKDPEEDLQTTSTSTVEFFSGPDIKISGAELELAYAPIRDFNLQASLSLLHGSQSTVVDPFPPPVGSGIAPPPAVLHFVGLPDWAGSLSANWNLAHTHYGVWKLNLQANGTADYYAVPNAPILKGYWLLDGRFALAEIPLGSSGGKLEVAAWSKNITDKSYQNFNYQAAGIFAPANFAGYGQPRTTGLSVQYKFH